MRGLAAALLPLLLAGTAPSAQESLPPVSAIAPDESRLAYAQRLLREEDNTDANLRAALTAYDEALAGDLSPSDTASVYADKALALLRLGDLQESKREKQRYYQEGQQQAEKGIAADPRSAEAHFMRTANLGSYARERGVFKSLSSMGEIRGGFEQVLEIDPQHIDAQLSLARMDEAVPGFAGGSKKRAEERYRAVLERDPHFTRAMLDYAVFLDDRGREDEALELVKRALAEEKPTQPSDFRRFDRPRAEGLLEALSR